MCTWHSNVDSYWPGFTQNAPPPPPGYVYLVETCGYQFFLPVLVQNEQSGPPSAAALAQSAFRKLVPPLPAPATAPPRGQDGLVGLPEWFWVPASQWQIQKTQVSVGGVWAKIKATPVRLIFNPGGGLPAVSCPGPGTPYNASEPAAVQHSDCTYTYTHSSKGQPGNAYTASVTVVWTATWSGSGNSGGTLPSRTRTVSFALPVAEGQALVTGGG